MSLTIAPVSARSQQLFELLKETEQRIAAHSQRTDAHALHSPVCAYHSLSQIKQKSNGTPVKHLCSIAAYLTIFV